MYAADGVPWDLITFFVFIIATTLTVPASLIVLWLYRRAVLRSMLERAGQAAAAESRPVEDFNSAHAALPSPPSVRLDIIDRKQAFEFSPEAGVIYKRARRIPRLAALIYAAAGFLHASILTALFIMSPGFGFSWYAIPMWLMLSWPIIPTVVAVAVANRHLRLLIFILFLLSPFLIGGEFMSEVRNMWIASMLVPTVALVLIANRPLRPVGPLIMVTVSIAITGVTIFVGMLGSLGVNSLGVILPLSAVIFSLSGFAAWRYLKLIAKRYDQRRLSDQSLLLNVYWLLFTLWQCLMLALMFGNILPGLLALLAYAGYRLVLTALYRPFQKAAREHTPVRLLLLRVFKSRGRNKHLLEGLELYWRHVGSIQLIAGTDLATANIEPPELLDFLVGGFSRRFLKDEKDLADKVSAMAEGPDPDGRFRTNEFFCHDDTWRATLARLVEKSDAVLMDLRGFSAKNQGVVFELSHLIDVVPVERVVLVIDKTSQTDLLQKKLDDISRQMSAASPNRTKREARLRTLVVSTWGARDVGRLLALLCQAAQHG